MPIDKFHEIKDFFISWNQHFWLISKQKRDKFLSFNTNCSPMAAFLTKWAHFDQNNLCLKRVLAPIRQTLIFIKVFISNCCWILLFYRISRHLKCQTHEILFFLMKSSISMKLQPNGCISLFLSKCMSISSQF